MADTEGTQHEIYLQLNFHLHFTSFNEVLFIRERINTADKYWGLYFVPESLIIHKEKTKEINV